MNLSGSDTQTVVRLRELLSWRTLVVVSPVFLLTVKHWTNAVVLILAIASVFFLVQYRQGLAAETPGAGRWRVAIAMALAGPVLAVGMGQWLRGALYPPNFDAPLRIALCAPVFWAVSRGWLNRRGSAEPITFLWMKYAFPMALVWTFIDRPSWTTAWGENVITTYFVDVLSFGSLTLLFALLSFAALTFFWGRLHRVAQLVSVGAVLVGIYLSVKSGSRTGWLNFPVFFAIWALGFAVPAWGRVKALTLLALSAAMAGVLVLTSPFLLSKIMLGINEIAAYHWSSPNSDGSASIRLSFYRMAVFYFLHNPLQGWGDLGWRVLMDSPEISQYASEYARRFPEHGFHNEILTSAVRSGIWGLASSVAFFLVPILWAIKLLHRRFTTEYRFFGFFILFYMLHQWLAGMTTEVTNLAFLASFAGLTMAVMLGESMALQPAESPPSI
jgi:O-antigen ligase